MRGATRNSSSVRAYKLRLAVGLLALALSASPAGADEFFFMGATTTIPTYGAHPIPGCACGVGPNDGFSFNSQGSFGDATAWQDESAIYDPAKGIFAPHAPGPGDNANIGGFADGYLPPTLGPPDYGNEYGLAPIYGYYEGTGYTGSGGFHVSDASGTIANLNVGGPGELDLGNLTVSQGTTIQSIGYVGIVQFVPGLPYAEVNITGYAPSNLVVEGGSLTSTTLTLLAGSPDPTYPGSLLLDNTNLATDTTQVVGFPASFDPASPFYAAPVGLTSSTLIALNELDIVGVSQTDNPNAHGTTTLDVQDSEVLAQNVVVATGLNGMGSGNPDGSAALVVEDASGVTATASLIVGDTGSGIMTVSGGSEVSDQQGIIANATGSQGLVTIDGSLWHNDGYLSVGNNGVGLLIVQNGGRIDNTGQYGNAYISGLAGSDGSEAIVGGDGSSWTTSGFFVVGNTETGTLNIEDNATVTSGDVMYVGLLGGSTGNVNVSGGAVVTTNFTGTYGNTSAVLAVDAGSTGNLTVSGEGSKFIANGAMVIGYGGDGYAAVTDGGAIEVTSSIFRVGRNEGSTGLLVIDGQGSSVTADSATLYIGYGGVGEVDVTNGASLSAMAINIGGQSTGFGTLNIDGISVSGQIGDLVVGDAGNGSMDLSNGADISGDDVTIGAQSGAMGEVTVSGQGTTLTAHGQTTVGGVGAGSLNVDDGGDDATDDLTIGSKVGGTGTVTVTGQSSTLRVAGVTIVGDEGNGDLSVDDGGDDATDELTIGSKTGSMGTVTVSGAGTELSASAETIVGDEGNGTLDITDGGDDATDDLTVGGQSGGMGAVNVMGAGTELNASGDVTVGDAGDGELDGSDDASIDAASLTVGGKSGSVGEVNLDTGASLNVGGDATVGDEQGSEGHVTIGVTDAADLSVGGNLTVGGDGTGTLVVNPGSSLTVDGAEFTIGDGATGNGTVTIIGGTFSFGGDLTIGSSGNGVMILQQGASNDLGGTSFETPSVTIGAEQGSTGTLLLDGSNTSLQVSDLTVGKKGQGTLTLTNGAVLTVNGDAAVADDISVATSVATVDSGSMLAINGDLKVGSQGIGQLNVTGGGQVAAVGAVSIGDAGASVGTVVVSGVQSGSGKTTPSSLGYGQTLTVGNSGSGQLTISGGGYVAPTPGGSGEVDIAAQVGSTGSVNVSGKDPTSGANSILVAKNVAVGGTMAAQGGTGSLTVGTDGVVSIASKLKIWTTGTVDVSAGGSVTVGSSGAQAAAGTVQVNQGGTVGGGGLIVGDLVNNGGNITPGDPVTLTVEGDYLQTDGALNLEVDGAAMDAYDRLIATGKIQIDGGVINLDFADGFAPTLGEKFDFFSAPDGIDLSNVQFDFFGLMPGFQFETFTDAATGDFGIQALNDGVPNVPEPISLTVFGAGLAGVVALRRLRRSSQQFDGAKR